MMRYNEEHSEEIEATKWYAEVKMWSPDHMMTISEGGKVEKGMQIKVPLEDTLMKIEGCHIPTIS